jgi:Fe-S cluster biogenesis protein NfuA
MDCVDNGYNCNNCKIVTCLFNTKYETFLKDGQKIMQLRFENSKTEDLGKVVFNEVNCKGYTVIKSEKSGTCNVCHERTMYLDYIIGKKIQ